MIAKKKKKEKKSKKSQQLGHKIESTANPSNKSQALHPDFS